MRRILSWLIMAPALVAVVVFALNNKSPVALDLWPFSVLVEMPLYLALLLALALGALAGGFAAWLGQGRVRANLRDQAYEGEVARRELAAERDRCERLQRDLERLRAADETAGQQAPGEILPALSADRAETLAPEDPKPQTASQ